VSTLALVVGHATLDAAGGTLVPGGTAYYAAHALAALGAEVRVLTRTGADFPADGLRAGPGVSGRIEALVLPSSCTTRFVNEHDAAGRRSQRVLATAPPLDPGALPAGWLAADLLLLAPVLGEVDPAAFAGAVRAQVTGLCVQGLVREVRGDGLVVPRRLDPASGALSGIDAAFVGDDEAAGQPDLVAGLAACVPIVAATHGARGSEVRARGRTLRAGVHPAREADPTGAGDVYAAAFLHALVRGGTLEGAARLGAAAASIVIEGVGGAALPRIAEAFARAGAVPVE
jgi:sugar/nucleoside kinase (ribokinase family)